MKRLCLSRIIESDMPQVRILMMFVALKGWLESEGLRGCSLISTA